MIENLSVLTDELNKTNDFSKFVISVRQGFKELRVNAWGMINIHRQTWIKWTLKELFLVHLVMVAA